MPNQLEVVGRDVVRVVVVIAQPGRHKTRDEMVATECCWFLHFDRAIANEDKPGKLPSPRT
jgi:hypothetical protein